MIKYTLCIRTLYIVLKLLTYDEDNCYISIM